MPRVQINGQAMNYEIEGPPDGEVLTFGHAQILDLRSWAPQAAAFSDRYRVFRCDFRGHGGSALSAGGFRVEDIADDVVAMLDALEIEKTHYIGSSLGGMVGFALALEHGERLQSLTLLATQGRLPGTSEARIRGQIEDARRHGATMASQMEVILARYLPDDYRARQPEAYAALETMAAETPIEGFERSSEAILAMDFDGRLAEIETPTFVVAGELDVATPAERMTLYRDRIAGARMTVIEGAGHFPNFEQPERFNAAFADFLGSLD